MSVALPKRTTGKKDDWSFAVGATDLKRKVFTSKEYDSFDDAIAELRRLYKEERSRCSYLEINIVRRGDPRDW